MHPNRRHLNNEELASPISDTVFDALWDWTARHSFPYPPNVEPILLTPKMKKDAFRLGKILCRGVLANQSVDISPDWNHYVYEFMLGTRLIALGASAKDFEEVQSLYLEFASRMSSRQAQHLLYYFIGKAYEGKKSERSKAVGFVIEQSLFLKDVDESVEDFLYSLWSDWVAGEGNICLLDDQLSRLQPRLEAMKDTKAARAYKRRRRR